MVLDTAIGAFQESDEKMRSNIKEVFRSPGRLLLSMEDMVKLLNPKIIGMRIITQDGIQDRGCGK